MISLSVDVRGIRGLSPVVSVPYIMEHLFEAFQTLIGVRHTALSHKRKNMLLVIVDSPSDMALLGHRSGRGIFVDTEVDQLNG